MDAAEVKLNQLGYRQDLRRALSQLGNLAVALSVGSVLSAVCASFSVGYSHGGPALMVWAWILHTILALTVAATLAELCSSIPTAGSLFNWSYYWGGRYKRFWCWITGWLNLVAYIAGTASSAFACAYVISNMVVLSKGGVYGGGRSFTPKEYLGLIAAVLVSQGLIDLLPTKALVVVNHLSVFWNLAGTLTLVVLLPSLAVKRQSASFVFTYIDRESYGYVKNDGYTAMLGFLFVVYALAGQDSGTHMAEETKRADKGAAKNIIISLCINSVFGFGFLLAILFSLQETSPNILVSGQAGGFMISQIFYDVFVARFGSSTGAIVTLGIPAIGFFLNGSSSLLVTSRILWAFAREGALPLSPTLRKVNRGTGVPVNAVAVSTALCIAIALPLLGSTVAFSACISIAILGGAMAYLIPMSLKLSVARDKFVPGPVNLGRWSTPINAFACVYILFICAAAVMPTVFPITKDTLNYAPIAFGGLVIGAVVVWFLPRFGARYWFAVKREQLGNVETASADGSESAVPINKEFEGV